MTLHPGSTAQPPCRRTGAVSRTAHPHPHSSSEPSSGAGPASYSATMQGLRPTAPWSYLELAALPTAPACARLHTKQVLWEWGLAGLSEASELIVSELVTNAVQITATNELLTPVRLWLSNHEPRVLIEVWDGDPQPPILKPVDASGVPPLGDESGRGLFLVASLSKRWGWYPERALGGKVVWGVIADG